ncbi:MAG: hypothetical protein IPP06_14935 [Saprospiraceae bacterium]|nr:hypothetical protein [Candidatus Vicinibacter affinis]
MMYSGNLSFWLGILIYLTNSGISLMANEFLISSNRGNISDLAILINRPEMFKFRSKGTYAPMDCDTIILRNDRKIIAQSIIRKGEYIYYQLCNPDSIRNRVMHVNAIRQIIYHSNSSIDKADTLLKILGQQADSLITPLRTWEVINLDGTTKYKFSQGQVVTVLLKAKPKYKEFYKYRLQDLKADSLYLKNRTTQKISALYTKDILNIAISHETEALWFAYIFIYCFALGLMFPLLIALVIFFPFGLTPTNAPTELVDIFKIGVIIGLIGIGMNIFYSVENKKSNISNPFTTKWKWTEVKSEINPDKNLKMP